MSSSIRQDPFVINVPASPATPVTAASAPAQQAGWPPPAQQGASTGYPPPAQQGASPGYPQATAIAAQPGDSRVAVDPFLMHARPPQLGPQSVLTASDPFLLQGRSAGPEVVFVHNDPFLTHQRPPERMTVELLSRNPFMLGAAARMAAWEVSAAGRQAGIVALFGAGDPKQESTSGMIYTLVPWFFFIWVMLLLMVQFHYLQAFTVFFVIALFLMCLTVTLSAFVRPSTHIVALRTLGSLCCAAIAFGALVGHRGWVDHARQYWWMQTGSHYAGVSADMPSSMFADAAWIRFAEDSMAATSGNISSGNISTLNSTVDHQRSVGFIDGPDTYCVAPVLNEAVDSAGLIPVHFWVVGLNCCDSMGNFQCDDSRQASAEFGVVLVDQVSGHYEEKWRQAIVKAEVAYDLRGSGTALLMRWVIDPDAVSRWYGWRTFFYMTVAAFGSFCICAVLGLICNYFGVGRYEELLEKADDQKTLHVEKQGKT